MLCNCADETTVVSVDDSRIKAEMDPGLLFLLSVNFVVIYMLSV